MYPELFELPFVHLTVKSYGVIMVLSFLAALFLMRKLARRLGEDPEHISNVAMYALISGVIGARIFYVIHHFSEFDGNFLRMIAVWHGGLEYYGGFILGLAFTVVYLFRNKLSTKRYLDILAVGLMLGLAFGRIGCFFSGCCFGKPAEVAWAVSFPYASDVYYSQVKPNPQRNRTAPHLDLPAEYFGYLSQDGQTWLPADEANKFYAYLKPFELLTEQQKHDVTKGQYRCLGVHPSQLYSSLNAFVLTGVLFLFWRRFAKTVPGSTLAFMMIIYGISRFMLEFIRDDNPFEYAWWLIYRGGTISQNIGIYMAILGLILIAVFTKIKPKKSKD